MKKRIRQRRITIVAVWLICLIIADIIISGEEYRICTEKAQKQLLEQAETVAQQLPSILENNYYAELGSMKMQEAKLKALAMGLEDFEDLEEAKGFLDEYIESADLAGLTVFNRKGAPLYVAGEGGASELTREELEVLRNVDIFEAYEKLLEHPESYRDIYLSSEDLNEGDGFYVWSTKNKRWYLAIDSHLTEAEKRITDYFDWKTALQRVAIGKTGFVLAMDGKDGTVLSWPDAERIGRPVEDLRISLEGRTSPASVSDLQAAFSAPDQVLRIQIGEESYFAARAKVDNALILALLPEQEVNETVSSEVTARMLPLTLLTGISALVAFFHVADVDPASLRRRGKYTWDSVLSGRLTVLAMLVLASAAGAGLFLEALSVHADTYRYCQLKSDMATMRYASNMDARQDLENWFENEYLTRCRIAGIVLDKMDPEEVNPAVLQELASDLSVRYVYVLNSRGQVTVSNSPYDRAVTDEENPFHALLEGRSEMASDLEEDAVSGEMLKKIGISRMDENNNSKGLILIETDDNEFETIRKNLSLENLFEQLCLTEDTAALVVSDSNSEEERTIEYLGMVEDGSGLTDWNLSGMPVSVLKLDEKVLQDGYSGAVSLTDKRYFGFVRHMNDSFFLMLKPQDGISRSQLVPVALSVVITLVFLILLAIVSCLGKWTEPKPEEESDAEAHPEDPDPQKQKTTDPKHGHDDVKAMFDSLVYRKKPYFEERWPKDSTRWKDKTTDQKFAWSLHFIFIIALASIYIHGSVRQDNSLWYYSLIGEWSPGFNLHSFTNCVFSICLLIVLKMLLHKLLYLTARAAKPKGETICSLADSFLGYTMVIVGIVICLRNIGVDTKTLTVSGTVTGVIFGFGCQNIIADILAGILMTFEGVAHVGDFVYFNGNPGLILSIGVRTTCLKWFGEITVVRNNDFKNYVNRPNDAITRPAVYLAIDLNESLERVEGILKKELPEMHKRMSEICGEEIDGPNYIGVSDITDNAFVLMFTVLSGASNHYLMEITLKRELKLMCERHGIRIAMPHVVLNS